jgi:pimeloyl-ACP methyl ester carboxylesterase
MKVLLAGLAFLALTTSVHAEPELHRVPRADGSLIDVWLDAPDGASQGLLLLAQGSGCLPVRESANLAAVRDAFPDHTAMMVEKIGVSADAGIADGFIDCPSAFHERYTLSRRLDDYRAVLDGLLAEDDGDLVLFGGSEGGLAVAALAVEYAPQATIILSSATGMSFGEMVRATVPPEGHATIDAGFAAARADPEGDTLFAGSTHRFWADILDFRGLDHMLRATSPLLLIQGGRDDSSPLASARLTADAFAQSGLCNLTYWEFPALDHGMASPDGTARLADIAALAASWAAAPMGSC